MDAPLVHGPDLGEAGRKSGCGKLYLGKPPPVNCVSERTESRAEQVPVAEYVALALALPPLSAEALAAADLGADDQAMDARP